jgi:Nup53/35/40-type RNA recognition motif
MRKRIYPPQHQSTTQTVPPHSNNPSKKVSPSLLASTYQVAPVAVQEPPPSLFGSPSSPTKPVDPTPVIIFGFPPSHSALIIREYERYGPILEHFFSNELPPSQPSQEIVQGTNWLRITYADPVSAARAVGTNGQIFGGAYMVGATYAAKPEPASQTKPAEEKVERREERGSSTSGERKMPVVRGGQNMFAKKESKSVQQETVGWGEWVWRQVSSPRNEGAPGGEVVAGGEGVLARTIRGISETVFGF